MANETSAPKKTAQGEPSQQPRADSEEEEVDLVETETTGKERQSTAYHKLRRLTNLVASQKGISVEAAARLTREMETTVASVRRDLLQQQQQDDEVYLSTESLNDLQDEDITMDADREVGQYPKQTSKPELPDKVLDRLQDKAGKLKKVLKEGKDWKEWESQLLVNLRLMGLDDIDQLNDYGVYTNRAVRYFIDSSTTTDLCRSTSGIKTPLALYKHLKTMYGPEERGSKVEITRSYHKLAWKENEKVEDFLTNVEETWRLYSLEVSELDASSRIYHLLSMIEDRRIDVYASLATYIARDWQGLDGDQIIAEMRTLILNRCRERGKKEKKDDKKKDKDDRKTDDKKKDKDNKSSFTPKKCNRCGKLGHLDKDCRVKQPLDSWKPKPDNSNNSNHTKQDDQTGKPKKTVFTIGKPMWNSDEKDETDAVYYSGDKVDELYGSHYTRFSGPRKVYHAKKSDRWLFDTGSDSHIVCDHTWLNKGSYIEKKGHIGTGGGQVVIHGYGDVDISLKCSNGSYRTITLSKVLFCPDFDINIMSGLLFAQRGGDFDTRRMVDRDGDEVACFDISRNGFLLTAVKGDDNASSSSSYLATTAKDEHPKAMRRH